MIWTAPSVNFMFYPAASDKSWGGSTLSYCYCSPLAAGTYFVGTSLLRLLNAGPVSPPVERAPVGYCLGFPAKPGPCDVLALNCGAAAFAAWARPRADGSRFEPTWLGLRVP